MRVSCEIPANSPTKDGLIEFIKALGLDPIVTPAVIRTVYEGTSIQMGEAIVKRYEEEPDHGIVAEYTKDEKAALERANRRRKG